MGAMESKYRGTHTTREERRSLAMPRTQTNLHPVPSPPHPDDEVLEGATTEVSPSTEERLLQLEDSLVPQSAQASTTPTITTPTSSPH